MRGKNLQARLSILQQRYTNLNSWLRMCLTHAEDPHVKISFTQPSYNCNMVKTWL
jgi:hypothetical protein